MKSVSIAACLAVLTPLPLAAQTVLECQNHFAASVHGVAEPLEENTATYANGAIRFLRMDLGEPACCSQFIAVLHPAGTQPPDDYRKCSLVAVDGSLGFSEIDFFSRQASYDPASGLTLRFPTMVDLDGTAVPYMLVVSVNQATGVVYLD